VLAVEEPSASISDDEAKRVDLEEEAAAKLQSWAIEEPIAEETPTSTR